MSSAETDLDRSRASTAVRNALVLAAASAFGGAAGPIVITLGALAALQLLDPSVRWMATLPVTTFSVGVALGAAPAALLSGRLGRRFGFLLGAAIGALGGLVGGLSILGQSFVGLIAGTALVGFSGAFLQQYRFAAADGAPDQASKARAISWVMIGGVAAAIIGPQTLLLTDSLFAANAFAGPFIAIVALMAIAAGLLWLLVDLSPAKTALAGAPAGGRPLSEIARQPRFIVAVTCAIASFAMMSLVMTAAPLAMIAHGHTQAEAALGIQWHVIAMYVPSFVTGSLIARFGKEKIVATGLALLLICAAIALTGADIAHFWATLVILGVGWNFGFVGATAMLTETYRPEEAARAQGFNDFLLFGFVALASAGSGGVFAVAGWNAVNLVVFPVAALALAALLWQALAGRRPAAAGTERPPA
jgi:MFS family permease